MSQPSAGSTSEPTPREKRGRRAADPPPAPEGTACEGCGAPLPDDHRFCRACGAVRPRSGPGGERGALVSQAGVGTASSGEGACPACGAAQPAELPPFCRQCGHRLGAAARGLGFREPAAPAATVGATASGRCRSCGEALAPERKFCPACGTATARQGDAEPGGLKDPAWRVVTAGLSHVFEGTALLVAAAVFAAAVATLVSLFDLGAGDGMLRVGLLGAASLAAVAGLGLILWGDVLDLRVPPKAKGRVHAVVVLGLGAAAGVTGLIALGRLAAAGFDGAAVPRGATLLGAVALLLVLGRLVAFATLLRRLAFALRHYRIAQGSVGFIVYVGVGLAVVGLLNLLFRSAADAARTFGELLALAFVAGTALWAIGMARRSRDLVRQRLG